GEVSINGSNGNANTGNINLDNSTGIGSLTAAGTAGGNGGNVTLLAFANGGASGVITVPTNKTIQASGNGAGSNGTVTIVAGGTGGTTITTGNINTSAG